jgi:hypothetical protein
MSINANPSDVLYHYCSMESLYGILDSLALRLTNIRYMNDSKETSWVYELAEKAFSRIIQAGRPDEEAELIELLRSYSHGVFQDESFFPNWFCVCYSKNGDSLSQWRAYANDGRGVAIGFNRDYLESFTSEHQVRLEDVEYLAGLDLSAFEDDFKLAVSQMQSERERLSRPLMAEEIEIIARKVSMRWNEKAPFCKNPAFKEEHEVRFVHSPVLYDSKIGPVQCFHRDGVIVPYISLPLHADCNPISKIVLGPRNRIDHNRRGISELARVKGIRLALDQFNVSSASYGEVRRTETLPGLPS